MSGIEGLVGLGGYVGGTMVCKQFRVTPGACCPITGCD